MSNPPRLEVNGLGQRDEEFGRLWQGVANIGDATGAEKRFNAISDRVTGLNEKIDGNVIVSGVKQFTSANPDLVNTAMKMADQVGDISGKVKAVKQTLSRFAESSQVIMKGLDAVQELHPFIGIVVLAFKAAIQLELTRRGNDAKVLLLKTQMMDMMEVLLDLKNIKDTQKVQPDGTTIEGRMQRVVQAAEKNIRDCSATCEKYIHKKFIVKLFDGSRWEAKLGAFATTFSARKDEFAFALSIHTAQGVDNLQRTMVGVEAHLRTSGDETSMLLLFRQLESPKERELQKFIAEHGGPKACLENEKIFKELQAKTKDAKAPEIGKNAAKTETTEVIIASIRDEMRQDIDMSLAKDRKQFDRKFEAVQEKLEEMRNVVKRSSDRIITVITSGPHDRIIDQDLHSIWKDMAWRGSVKARHFIVAVQDFFFQKYSQEDQEVDDAVQEALDAVSRPVSPAFSHVSEGTDAPPPSAVMTHALQARIVHQELQDRWAIQYVSLAHVRSVLEAFDDDASGWISVKEANAFTSSRPLNYSVIKWLAYWAAGFRLVCARYARDIQATRTYMMDLAHDVLPCNRARVDKYLATRSMYIFDYLVRGILEKWDEDDEDYTLMTHFEDFVQSEEQRLQKGLERFGYDVDAFNTLQMITGSGRLERHIMPLVHLLLKRHLGIMQLACKIPLYDDELYDAEQSADMLWRGMYARMTSLESNFRNQNVDPKDQFAHAYDGMFSVIYGHYRDENIDGYEYPESYYDSDEEPDQDILKYGVAETAVPDYYYDDVDVTVAADESSTSPFAGLWTGTWDYIPEQPETHDGLAAVRLQVAETGAVAGHGKDSLGSFTITGQLSSVDGEYAQFTFKTEYTSDAYDPFKYVGTTTASSMTGQWGFWSDDASAFRADGNFTWNRTPLIAAIHRPNAASLETERARAQWSLALNAVEEQVRQQLWSWSFFRQRRDNRRKFVDAYKRVTAGRDADRYGRFWPDDDTDYSELLGDLIMKLRPEDANFYRYIGQRELEQETSHLNAECDSCEAYIVGARHKCLVCKTANPWDGIDLCINCTDKHVYIHDKNLEHHPSHDILKTLRFLPLRQIVRVLRAANQGVTTAKEIFAKADSYLAKAEYAANGQDGQDDAGNKGDDTDEEVLIPSCFYCQQQVSRPCWYCAECENDIFLCNDCEAKQLDISKKSPAPDTSSGDETDGAESDGKADAGEDTAGAEENAGNDREGEREGEVEGDKDGEEGEAEGDEGEAYKGREDEEYEPSESGSGESSDSETSSWNGDSHYWWHVLIKVQDIVPEPPRVELETRLTMLEQKFAAHETSMRAKLDGLETTINNLSEKVENGLDGRLTSLEALLRQLLARMG
ncbi:hypothetical protein AURDEDRAFT_180879 [Auricularia subglabra TFB-10046 SS5]|nr:hypothetical protein AURDEDRAFT_180879 [Auricularia subglabra TFB-10046 SS5]